jgi:hypothetical protein
MSHAQIHRLYLDADTYQAVHANRSIATVRRVGKLLHVTFPSRPVRICESSREVENLLTASIGRVK